MTYHGWQANRTGAGYGQAAIPIRIVAAYANLAFTGQIP